MGLAVKPIECPGGCLGCYEKGIRDRGTAPAFDLEKVMATLREQMALDKENKWNSPTLHGGEPLMLPLDAIDAVLKTIFEKYGKSGIQTSGVLLRPEHIEIFKKYKTNVGISIDGDTAALNAGRWNAPGFEATYRTAETLRSIVWLTEAGLDVSTITLLRKCNAGTAALRDDLMRFALRMRDEFKVSSSRFNALIGFDNRTIVEEQLFNHSLFEAIKKLTIKAIADDTLKWYPMLDFIRTLRGEDAVCFFGECDPWATESEIPILGDGSLGVCLKVGGGGDGIASLRVEKSRARYEMLEQIKQDAGGCRGCFWWMHCKGGCPGAGIEGDWRNRTRFCDAYKQTFEFLSTLPLFHGSCAGKGTVTGSHGDRQHGDSNDPAWRKAHPEWGKK